MLRTDTAIVSVFNSDSFDNVSTAPTGATANDHYELTEGTYGTAELLIKLDTPKDIKTVSVVAKTNEFDGSKIKVGIYTNTLNYDPLTQTMDSATFEDCNL